MISMKLGVAALAVMAVPMQAAVTISASVMVETSSPGADGKAQSKLEPATRVTSDQKLVYRVTITNGAQKDQSNVLVVQPIHAAMNYAGPYADTPAPDLSIDGKSFGALETLTVDDGNGGKRAATLADVRVVRWKVASIKAGAATERFFRVALK